jgi:hypothetical protein
MTEKRITNDSPEKVLARKAYAKDNTWAKRIEDILS